MKKMTCPRCNRETFDLEAGKCECGLTMADAQQTVSDALKPLVPFLQSFTAAMQDMMQVVSEFVQSDTGQSLLSLAESFGDPESEADHD